MTSHIYRRKDLSLGPRALARAIDAGRLRRVTQGWYVGDGADPDVVRALQLRGRLSCLSVTRKHQIWTPRDTRLHVAIRKSDPAPRIDGVIVHRLPTDSWPTEDPSLPLDMCLDHALRHHSVEAGLMVLESAVRQRLIGVDEAIALIGRQPARAREHGLHLFNPRAESGSETRVRLWAERRNLPVRAQVQIPGVGRVDLLVGDALVIEADSVAWHTSATQYETDRRRDLALQALGFQVVRLSYTQIFGGWPDTVRHLVRVLATGRYRSTPAAEAAPYLPELLPYAA